jgi:uncharacterized membrane protein
MWGNWSVVLLSGVGILLIALGFAFFGLIFGLVFALIVIGAIIGLAVMRRSNEYVERDEPARVRRDSADISAAGESDRGAPAAVDGTPAAPAGTLPASPRGPSREG